MGIMLEVRWKDFKNEEARKIENVGYRDAPHIKPTNDDSLYPAAERDLYRTFIF